ncbi:MAG: hypothetical protein HDT33_11605 [Clostridiales bacterium]|nr:hypothetical protein [Clostridiales bacterium]
MRNTGVEYSSADRTPVVLPEMAQLLPPLTEEQLAALEADLLANGCYSPIIVNEDMTIIDGHNRQELCTKHGIPYKMAVFSFVDMLEAKQWALDTQKGRRNLDKWELGKIALKLREDVEARARERQQEYHGNQYESGLPATLPEVHSAPVDTRKELAEAVGIGERTMGKVMQIDEHAPPAIREALDNGELSINQGYNLTRQLQDVPEEERGEVAAQLVELEKAKKEIRQLDAEADRRGKIAGLFCKAFERAVLLTPTEANVRLWVEGARMRTDEIEDSMKDARNLSEVFSAIADILERMLPIEADAEGGCT